MGTYLSPKHSFDDADLENIEKAFQAIWATLVAHAPAGALVGNDVLQAQIRTTIFALARMKGETEPEMLRSQILERIPLSALSQDV